MIQKILSCFLVTTTYNIEERGYTARNIIQKYNQKIRYLQEIELVPTILRSFSFTLHKSYTCPLIQTFCASPNSFHLRADSSLCNTTLWPLTTKIQCYTVLIYSTCNQIKTSSCSSSYSLYYELVYLSVCVLEVFSGRALTVVLQKIIITTHSMI